MTLPAKGTKTIEVTLDGKKAPFIIAFKGDSLHMGLGSLEIHSQVGVLNVTQTGFDYIPDPDPFYEVRSITPILNPNVKLLDNLGREFSCFDTFQQLAKICDMVWTQSIGSSGDFTLGSTGVHGVSGCYCYTGAHDGIPCPYVFTTEPGYTGIVGETGAQGDTGVGA